MQREDYIIRGGAPGRERLRVLSRVMQASTHSLLQRAGVRPGMACLEIGCGGGDVAFDIARMVAPGGRVVGTDIDPEKIEMAHREAAEQRLDNIEFRLADITRSQPEKEFDLVHARFLLTHLADPLRALMRMRGALRDNGLVVIQDIDFRGHVCHPDCLAFRRYVELYTEAVRRKGADADIGPRLPGLLAEAGFEDIAINVVQPAGITGEVKLIAPLTLENISGAVVAEGLASREEVRRLIEELYEFVRTPGTFVSLPRVVEAWATCPAT